MRGMGVKERLKGKDSLREKRLRECQTEKKNRELLREGGKDTKGGRDKENKRGEGESDGGRREIQRERESEKMQKRNERHEMRERYQGTELQRGEMEGEKKTL